jgi:peptidyl-dipeptidase Dcp
MNAADTHLDPANPFAKPSPLPYGLPDFAAIEEAHFRPALLTGMAQERAEIEAIATDPEPPTVVNTLEALERAGALLDRVTSVFFNQTSADSTPVLDDLEEEIAPLLAEHHDAIYLDQRLFARVDALHRAAAAGTLSLDAATARLLDDLHRDFRRAGVALPAPEQQRLRELNAGLSELETAFGRELLADTNASAVVVEDEAELAGLPADAVAAAAEAAIGRDLPGRYLLALQLPTQQPELAHLEDRGLRERLHHASVSRGQRGGEHDTRALLVRIARLRAERAALLGYPNHAAYVAEDGTAKTTDAVLGLLTGLVPAVVANARREAEDIQTALDADVPGATAQPWDWAYYAERVRFERFDLDDSLLRPYLELDGVLRRGVFGAATELYGITFSERTDLLGYHPQARVFEVHDADGTGLGLFLFDPYTRDSKRGGAWMDTLVDQNHLLDERSVVVNNLNIVKPPAGQSTLLSWDEVITLFHEFGHALHSLLSDVRYPSHNAGTGVPPDVVEYPSQVNEMWAWEPAIMDRYARHHETGAPMPSGWIATLNAARQFNEGFATTEYLAAALLDQAWHTRTVAELPSDPIEVVAFEDAALAEAGLALPLVPPRYRSANFNHVFGGGYAAAYYAYLWSEVLDADTVEWFRENGGLTRANGDRFRDAILSRGGSVDVMAAFTQLRGRATELAPLLARRGLTPSP